MAALPEPPVLSTRVRVLPPGPSRWKKCAPRLECARERPSPCDGRSGPIYYLVVAPVCNISTERQPEAQRERQRARGVGENSLGVNLVSMVAWIDCIVLKSLDTQASSAAVTASPTARCSTSATKRASNDSCSFVHAATAAHAHAHAHATTVTHLQLYSDAHIRTRLAGHYGRSRCAAVQHGVKHVPAAIPVFPSIFCTSTSICAAKRQRCGRGAVCWLAPEAISHNALVAGGYAKGKSWAHH
jgi:hypothetical protein